MQCPFSSCKNKCASSYALVAVAIALGVAIWALHLNQALFYTINSWHTILPNAIWETLNMLAYSKLFILPLLLCALTWVWRRDMIINVLLLVIAYYVLFSVLKIAVAEARPYIVLPVDSFFWLNHYEDAAKSAYKSFPSGHAGNTAVFVFACQRLFVANNKPLKAILFLLLLMVMLARICTGWHWPLDVLASAVVSYILVQVCLCKKITLAKAK